MRGGTGEAISQAMKVLMFWCLALCASLPAAPLTFDEMTKEITASVDQKSVSADFNFKNETDQTVEILRADAGCTCIQAGIKGGLTYKPGQSGQIRFSYDLGDVVGTVDKPLHVFLKGDPESQPSITLNIRVKVPELVVVEPKSLFWEVGEEAKAKTVTITMKDEKPIKVTSISGADARFKQELKTVEEGKKYEVVITPVTTDKVAMGVVHLETDHGSRRYRTQRVFMVVRNPVKPAPATAGKP